MEAGRLKNQIILQRKVATLDAIAGEVITYTPVVTIAVEAQTQGGREFQRLQRAGVELDVLFIGYYRSDVDSTWRVVWRSQPYDIVSPPIDVDADRVWMRLVCKTAQV